MDDATRNEIRRIFEAQQQKRWQVATSSAEQRVHKLDALRRAILERRETLAAAIHADFRKNASEFELTELYPVCEEIRHVREHLADWMEPERVKTPFVLAGTKSAVRHEPLGVVLIISPWNYPFNLLFMPLVAAIAAGNTVMLKPSNKTPNLSAAAADLIRDVFAEDEVAIFTGDHTVSDALLELPFDHVLFTGSTRIGKKVMAKASEHLATVTLELGGKSPVILDKSADLEAAGTRIVWGKCLNAGQTCISPDYVLAHESVVDGFVAAAIRTIERFYGSTAADRRASDDFARLVDHHAFDRVTALIDRSVAQGARIAFGGGRDRDERYLEPTILVDVTEDMPVMSEEIFGPVLPVLKVRSAEEAAAFVRRHEKPLALYLFAREKETVEYVLANTTSGGSVVNDVFLHVANPYLPFGGVGASGQGNYHGEHGFKTFSHARAVLDRGIATSVPLFYPPYGERRSEIAQRVLRALE